MRARDDDLRRKRALRANDPLQCSKCDATTFRYRFHWPSAFRCSECGEKVMDCISLRTSA